MRKLKICLSFSVLVTCTFNAAGQQSNLPRPVTRSTVVIDGEKIENTVIVIDKTTSREELIATCNFLEAEQVLLTFESLGIGKCRGRQRIRYANGMITISPGVGTTFRTPTCFKSLIIEYSKNLDLQTVYLRTIKIN